MKKENALLGVAAVAAPLANAAIIQSSTVGLEPEGNWDVDNAGGFFRWFATLYSVIE